MPDLTALRDRVRAAEKADAKLFRRIGKALGLNRDGEWWWRFERLIQAEAWTDAALALVEAKLPYWYIEMQKYSDGWYVTLKPHSTKPRKYQGDQMTAPNAILSALLTALIDGGRADG